MSYDNWNNIPIIHISTKPIERRPCEPSLMNFIYFHKKIQRNITTRIQQIIRLKCAMATGIEYRSLTRELYTLYKKNNKTNTYHQVTIRGLGFCHDGSFRAVKIVKDVNNAAFEDAVKIFRCRFLAGPQHLKTKLRKRKRFSPRTKTSNEI